jgi:hypothetical protein
VNSVKRPIPSQLLQGFWGNRRQRRALLQDDNSTTEEESCSKVPEAHQQYVELPTWEDPWEDLYRLRYCLLGFAVCVDVPDEHWSSASSCDLFEG